MHYEHQNTWSSDEEKNPRRNNGGSHEHQHRGYSVQRIYRNWPYDEIPDSGNIEKDLPVVLSVS